MFKMLKGKPTLQELEREFNIETMRLGDITIRQERLNKERAKCLQKLDTLDKQGIETKKKIQAELKSTIGAKAEDPSNAPN